MLVKPRFSPPMVGVGVRGSYVYVSGRSGSPGGPYDQRPVEATLLTYTTEPLAEDVEVTGPVTAVLYASSTALDTDWVVKLSDVDPTGYSRLLTEGVLRARYRDSKEHPTLLVPGTVYPFTIDLWATSNLFKKGHRIRVTVSSSNFPRYDRNPNTGREVRNEKEMVVAVNTIYHDPDHPSHLVLPIIPRR